ncbi:MAG: hypothetical protein LBE11_05540 [Prevotellaceae bacterium]|jgi:hypothetical protein|nr:hypothetical protein [Prevotellaceae bacterium]
MKTLKNSELKNITKTAAKNPALPEKIHTPITTILCNFNNFNFQTLENNFVKIYNNLCKSL